MIVAGIDVGAATTKTIILEDRVILGYSIRPTSHDIKLAIEKVTKEALDKAGRSISTEDLDYVVSTGYGRKAVAFADAVLTEIICHAKGANFLMPTTRTIIDIGGQDSKVINVDDKGNVVNFVMNDKCAAGTGRFLEVMAEVLDTNVEELGPISLTSKKPCHISSTCTVFAESEMVSLRAQGKSREDMIAGIHRAIALRVVTIASTISFNKDIVFTGGVAKNIGVKNALEKEIGMEILVPHEPQIVGALGAALLVNR